MRSARQFFSLLLIVAYFPAAGCASQKSFSGSFDRRLTQAQQDWHFTHGRQFNAHAPQPPIPRTSAGVIQPMLDPMSLQMILDRLVYVSPLRGYPIRAAVVPDTKINAFTDGQTITVTEALLRTFQYRDDVIASVMAHELGHILASHVPERKSRNTGWDYLSYLTPALSALPYGGYYSSAAGMAVREGAKIRNYSYDRLQENEADAIGVYLAMRAGFNPLGLSDFFEVVKSSGYGAPQNISVPTSAGAIPQSLALLLLSSSPLYRIHPPSEKRRQIVERMSDRLQGRITQEAFRKESSWQAALYEILERRSPR